ncbi:phosphoribosylanthranilate isomerase [Desulfovibrio sp. OttesenSCG-928-A18]|nr:phosphoribosylanthranilate isomerase [Desulfovibrio sp. OttesenSCG-928-A18]
MKVKICGITRESDISLCVDAGADACGFVVQYPADVPWNLDAEKAASLVRLIPGGTSTFMVTGGSPDRVVGLARQLRPDFVQLHHEETLAELCEISGRLKALGISTVKALRIDSGGRLNFEIPDIAVAAGALEKAGADALLIDSFTRARPGGSGRAVDPGAYMTLIKSTSLPVILAGGLSPDKLNTLVPAKYPPYMLDVLSGVESSPGIKDKDKVAAFVKAARALQKEQDI